MSEDAKKTELSEEALDNVAGGTTAQSVEILNVMAQFDSDGVSKVLEEAGALKGHRGEVAIAKGTMNLLNKHFGIQSCPIYDLKNVYVKNGQSLSHDDVMGMVKDKAQFLKDSGFEMM